MVLALFGDIQHAIGAGTGQCVFQRHPPPVQRRRDGAVLVEIVTVCRGQDLEFGVHRRALLAEITEPRGEVGSDDWEAVATSAGLHYTSDTEPGIARRRCGRGFTYVADVGSGPDAATRLRQYRYHERWREIRDDTKFARLIEFAEALPEIRKRVAGDLSTTGLTRMRSIAAVVRLIDTSLIRVGTGRHATENETFGATTLESRHVGVVDESFRLDFVGKGDIEHSVEVDDSELAAVISESLALDQPQLFCFTGDDGALYDINSGHVNDYLADIAGSCATAKTFRTWGATAIAVRTLATAQSDKAPKQEFLAAVDAAAEAPPNTRAVCRSCYVAPTVTVAAGSGALADAWASSRSGRWSDRAENTTAKLLQSGGSPSSDRHVPGWAIRRAAASRATPLASPGGNVDTSRCRRR